MEDDKAEVWQNDDHKSLKIITKCITTVAAIGAVVYLEVQALNAGINGTLLAASIAVVAGLGGYELKSILERKKQTDE